MSAHDKCRNTLTSALMMQRPVFFAPSAIIRNLNPLGYRHIKADLGNLNTSTDQRLDALETRITNIDKRLIREGI